MLSSPFGPLNLGVVSIMHTPSQMYKYQPVETQVCEPVLNHNNDMAHGKQEGSDLKRLGTDYRERERTDAVIHQMDTCVCLQN